MKTIQLVTLAGTFLATPALASDARICYTNFQGAVFVKEELVLKCHGQPGAQTLEQLAQQGYRIASVVESGATPVAPAKKLVFLDRGQVR